MGARLSDGQAGEIPPDHVQSVVGGQLLDAVPPAAAGVRPAAEGALRRGQANVHQPHRVVPLIPVRARHAGDGHGDVCPGDRSGP